MRSIFFSVFIAILPEVKKVGIETFAFNEMLSLAEKVNVEALIVLNRARGAIIEETVTLLGKV